MISAKKHKWCERKEKVDYSMLPSSVAFSNANAKHEIDTQRGGLSFHDSCSLSLSYTYILIRIFFRKLKTRTYNIDGSYRISLPFSSFYVRQPWIRLCRLHSCTKLFALNCYITCSSSMVRSQINII